MSDIAKDLFNSLNATERDLSVGSVGLDLSTAGSLTWLKSPPITIGSAEKSRKKFSLGRNLACPMLGALTFTKVHFMLCKKPDLIIYLPSLSTISWVNLKDKLLDIKVLTPLEAPVPGAEKT